MDRFPQIRRKERKIMKKRALALGLAVTVAMGSLSGCGQQNSTMHTETTAATEATVQETYVKKYPDVPSFDNLVSLKNYFLSCMEEGNYSPEFYYDGNIVIDAATICRMAAVAFCYIQYDADDPFFKRAQMAEYPGDRMIRAYKTGDMSVLNDEEQKALEIAIQVVEEAKAEAETDLVLELKLHDWLCDHITYDDSTRDVLSADAIPTNLSAVGALVNGAANCQGYADGFYVLATLAGFTVDRQYCQENSGGYHVINNILIDDQWSIVDVTYDDNSIRLDTEVLPDRHMFNVGRDIANQEYSWPEEFEHHPIVETTTDHYFYFTEENEEYPFFGQAFDHVEDMGRAIVEQWKEGRVSFQTMLKGGNADWSDVKEAILKAMEEEGMTDTPSFYTTSVNKGANSFFTVNFDAK